MSNVANKLELLEQNRKDILLSELGVFFHNLGKLSAAFLAYQRCSARKKLGLSLFQYDQLYKNFNYQAIAGLVADYITSPNVMLTSQDWNRLKSSAQDWIHPATNNFLPEDFRKLIQKRNINLPRPLDDRRYAIGDFIEYQSYKWYEHKTSGQRIKVIFPGGSKATELTEISHNASSGIEKEGSINWIGLQSYPSTYRANVFGYETKIDEEEIEDSRKKIIKTAYSLNRKNIWQVAKENFAIGVTDTRRTINDVSLWDISSSTASFYKATMARVILDNVWIPRSSFDWRVLHIGFDGLSFLERAPTIGDLMGRQSTLQEALDEVRELLEMTYPLGNEIYRDENGSAFVVPSLDGDDNKGTKLRDLIEYHILNKLQYGELLGELHPRIHITEADKQAAVLHKALKISPPPAAPFLESLKYWWQEEAGDICTACGVRPQGWGASTDWQKEKAQRRNVCHVCLERRGKRAKIWAQARHKTGQERKPWERTIWLDEVADENGRLALVVGKFDLSHWLNGDMIQTMLVSCDPANNSYESKNPSFARIQRVWRTTQQFWKNVQNRDIPYVVQQSKQRLSIAVTNAGELRDKLGNYHAYETEINHSFLSVVWDSQDECFLTANNLSVWNEDEAQALLEQLPEKLPLFEPGGYGQQRRTLPPALIDRQGSKIYSTAYAPINTLLAEPKSFMALVPAKTSLDVASKIIHRYELGMSKVQNRLPLFLGLIFFDNRQPLYSALDAGRRLLKKSFQSYAYPVASTRTCSASEAPDYLKHPHFEQWQEVKLKLNDQDNEMLTWRVSKKMGDGDTDDYWYPYVHVQNDKDGNTPAGRRQYEHPQGSNQQWVYVEHIHKGDTIHFTPSHFSWLHLDTSSCRFEAGREIKPLQELDRITTVWKKLKELAAYQQLSETQLQAIITLLATKEESWGRNSNEFHQLAKAIKHKEMLDTLTIEDLTSGRLLAAFKLYHRILKEKLS